MSTEESPVRHAASSTPTLATLRASDRIAITRKEAAAALQVDPRTITVGIEEGTIPSVKLGRRRIIPREKFLQLFS